MRRLLPYLACFVSFLLFPVVGKAAWYCEYADLSKMKSIASNISVIYDYEIIDNDAVFNIKITNVYKDLYVYDHTNDVYYRPNPEQDITDFNINGLADGKSYLFTVYTTVDKCESEVIYSFYATTPSYNKFSTDPLCLKHQNYKLHALLQYLLKRHQVILLYE